MQTPLHAKICDHLWIGNMAASDNRGFMTYADISARVALETLKNADTETDTLPFPNDALLDAEIPAYLNQADKICGFIAALIKNGHDVLLQCEDGLSSAPCIAARYLIRYAGVKPADAIARMRVVYMTQQQQTAQHNEDAHIAHMTKMQPDVVPTLDNSPASQQRRALLALTNLSQVKLLK